jgi:hypothetical protein
MTSPQGRNVQPHGASLAGGYPFLPLAAGQVVNPAGLAHGWGWPGTLTHRGWWRP